MRRQRLKNVRSNPYCLYYTPRSRSMRLCRVFGFCSTGVRSSLVLAKVPPPRNVRDIALNLAAVVGEARQLGKPGAW